MELGPLTKLDKRNKTTSKNLGTDAMPEIFDFVAIFPIFDQFGAIRKPDFGRIVCK